MPEVIRTLMDLVEAVTAPHGPGQWIMPVGEVRQAFEEDFGGLPLDQVVAEPDGPERIGKWVRRKRAAKEFFARPAR